MFHTIENALLDPAYAALPRDSSTVAVTVLDNDLASLQVTPQRWKIPAALYSPPRFFFDLGLGFRVLRVSEWRFPGGYESL